MFLFGGVTKSHVPATNHCDQKIHVKPRISLHRELFSVYSEVSVLSLYAGTLNNEQPSSETLYHVCREPPEGTVATAFVLGRDFLSSDVNKDSALGER